MTLVILTGASGSGKTVVARAVGRVLGDEVEVHHFDSIGVPSISAMVAGWGSGDEWQRATTERWLVRLALRPVSERGALFEGQMRPAFLRDGLVRAGLPTARPMLVDCDDATRRSRLVQDRGQPELATDDMMRWAALMRAEAVAMGWSVLDTSLMSIEQSATLVGRLFSPHRPARRADLTGTIGGDRG